MADQLLQGLMDSWATNYSLKVPEKGVEPLMAEAYQLLRLARMPIPPLWDIGKAVMYSTLRFGALGGHHGLAFTTPLTEPIQGVAGYLSFYNSYQFLFF